MARSSNCSMTGLSKSICPYFKCTTKRNNAHLRSGDNRAKRKSTNPHNDGIKSNRNPKRFRR